MSLAGFGLRSVGNALRWLAPSGARLAIVAVLLSALSATAAWSQPAPGVLDERVQQLEAALAELRADVGAEAAANARVEALEQELQALRDELSNLTEGQDGLRDDLDAARVESEDLADSVWSELSRHNLLSGYATSYFRARKDENPYFRMVKLNLLINGQITSILRFFGEVEFEEAARVPKSGGGEIVVEQAYMELAPSPMIGMRLGAILVPFGYYNLYHEEWRHPFSSRPLVNQLVLPSTYVDVGLDLFGTLYSGESVSLNYEVAVVNGLTSGFVPKASSGGLRSGRPLFGSDNNPDKSFVGRLAAGFGEHGQVGVSGYWGPHADRELSEGGGAGESLAMGGVDALARLGPVILRVEGVGVRLESDEGVVTLPDADPETVDAFVVPTWLLGMVADVELQFFPSSLKDTFLGRFEDPKFFIAGRFDVATYLHDVAPASGPQEPMELMVSGGLGYRPDYRAILRTEFTKGFGDLDLHDDWRFTLSMAYGY